MDLYDYLKTQFTDLEGAKRWANVWFREWDQELPYPVTVEVECYSMRAMSAHISNVLEGKSQDDTGSFLTTNYTQTKYGFEVYSAMMDLPWWK